MFRRADPELDTALELAKSDPQQAAQVIRIAALYLKKLEPLPPALALFLGDAFENAMKRPTTSRGSELLMNLNLDVNHRRPKANFEHVGMDVQKLVDKDIPKGEAIIQVGEIYGIADSTVKRMHKKYIAMRTLEAYDDKSLYEAEQSHYAEKLEIKKSRKV
jgi:hypothetical protein